MLPFSRLSVLMNLLSANLHHACQRCVIYYGFFPLVEKMGLNIETVVMVTNVNNAGGRLKWVVIVGRSSDPFSCYQKLFEEGAFKWAISKYHLLLFVALMDAFLMPSTCTGEQTAWGERGEQGLQGNRPAWSQPHSRTALACQLWSGRPSPIQRRWWRWLQPYRTPANCHDRTAAAQAWTWLYR